MEDYLDPLNVARKKSHYPTSPGHKYGVTLNSDSCSAQEIPTSSHLGSRNPYLPLLRINSLQTDSRDLYSGDRSILHDDSENINPTVQSQDQTEDEDARQPGQQTEVESDAQGSHPPSPPPASMRLFLETHANRNDNHTRYPQCPHPRSPPHPPRPHPRPRPHEQLRLQTTLNAPASTSNNTQRTSQHTSHTNTNINTQTVDSYNSANTTNQDSFNTRTTAYNDSSRANGYSFNHSRYNYIRIDNSNHNHTNNYNGYGQRQGGGGGGGGNPYVEAILIGGAAGTSAGAIYFIASKLWPSSQASTSTSHPQRFEKRENYTSLLVKNNTDENRQELTGSDQILQNATTTLPAPRSTSLPDSLSSFHMKGLNFSTCVAVGPSRQWGRTPEEAWSQVLQILNRIKPKSHTRAPPPPAPPAPTQLRFAYTRDVLEYPQYDMLMIIYSTPGGPAAFLASWNSGEYGIPGLYARVPTAEDQLIVHPHELERVGRLTFLPNSRSTSTIVHNGVATLFACLHHVVTYVPALTPSGVTQDMLGELEIVVVPIDNHRLQRTVVRFRLLG